MMVRLIDHLAGVIGISVEKSLLCNKNHLKFSRFCDLQSLAKSENRPYSTVYIHRDSAILIYMHSETAAHLMGPN
jgi:hypothetical protein